MTTESAIDRIAKELHSMAAAHPAAAVKRGWLGQGIASFLGTLPVLVAIVGLLLQLPDMRTRLDTFLSSRTTNDTNLPLPRARIGVPTASSYRQDVRDAGVFFPFNILDGDKTTAWVECGGGTPVNAGQARMLGNSCTAGDYGVGESITIPLTEPTNIKLLRIRNGYERRTDLYFRNGRVRQLQVILSHETASQQRVKLNLSDEPEYQDFNFKGLGDRVTRIKLVILSVYRGEAFLRQRPYSDTAISDVQIIPVLRPG